MSEERAINVLSWALWLGAATWLGFLWPFLAVVGAMLALDRLMAWWERL